MSAALASNTLVDEAAVIRRLPGAGRRKCSDLAEVFPQECQGVLEVLRHVCPTSPRAAAAAQSGGPPGVSQAHRWPLLDELQRWLRQHVEERLGEPNSALGKAIRSRQKHWATLPRLAPCPARPGQSPGGASLEAVYSTAQKRPVLQNETRLSPAYSPA